MNFLDTIPFSAMSWGSAHFGKLENSYSKVYHSSFLSENQIILTLQKLTIDILIAPPFLPLSCNITPEHSWKIVNKGVILFFYFKW